MTTVSRPRYRLEWRDPRDLDYDRSFALWREFGGPEHLRMAALGMASAGATSAKEFHVAVLGPTGGAIRRVLTTAAEIGEWDPVVDELPSAVAGTSWAQDVESAGAAADLLESVRTATVRAVRAGAIERSRAATLMAEMRALLDEEERE